MLVKSIKIEVGFKIFFNSIKGEIIRKLMLFNIRNRLNKSVFNREGMNY